LTLQLDCKEVSRLISDGLDHALEPSVRARMRLHFVVCETCRNVEEQLAFLRRALRNMSREEPSQR
jgi:predicted anti-sigma-YlaC factor YlaD